MHFGDDQVAHFLLSHVTACKTGTAGPEKKDDVGCLQYGILHRLDQYALFIMGTAPVDQIIDQATDLAIVAVDEPLQFISLFFFEACSFFLSFLFAPSSEYAHG